MTGVSTDIGTSFVRPAGKAGNTLHARATLTGMGKLSILDIASTVRFLRELLTWVLSTGKSLAYTRVDFTNPNGELVAYGRKWRIAY